MTDRPKEPTVACHAWAFGRLGYPRAFEHIAELGFTAVDVPLGGADDPAALPLDRFLTEPTAIHALNADLAEHRLLLTDLFVALPHPVNDPDPTRRQRATEVFRRVIDAFAVIEKPSGITISPGTVHTGESREADFERAAHGLRELVTCAADASFPLSIEPHLGSIAQTPDETMHLLDQVPGLELTLDYSHFIAGGIHQREVAPLHAFTRHFHVRQGRPECLAVPVAEGAIDFDHVFALMRKHGYDGTITVEYGDSSWMGQDRVNVEEETMLMAGEVHRLIHDHWRLYVG